MKNKDRLVINQNIIFKIIKQIFIEQSNMFTKKNHLKAKNEDNINLFFNNNEIDVTISIDESYVSEQKIFIDKIKSEVKIMIELLTNYKVKSVSIVLKKID